MPAFSQGLERALHQALSFANERHHEYATLEHLLLALIERRGVLDATSPDRYNSRPHGEIAGVFDRMKAVEDELAEIDRTLRQVGFRRPDEPVATKAGRFGR